MKGPSEREQKEIDEVSLRARSFLEELAEARPVPIGGGAFAVRVSGETLATIARSPLVRRIYSSDLRR